MAYYLLQAAYTNEAWAAQARNPQNPIDRVRPAIERLGGSIESAFYTFGEYDLIAIVQFPDNVDAVAFAVAVFAGGAAKAYKTTPLITIEQGLEAMRKGATAGYRPPRS